MDLVKVLGNNQDIKHLFEEVSMEIGKDILVQTQALAKGVKHIWIAFLRCRVYFK